MEDGELRRYVREAFRDMNPETPHISVEEIAEFAKDKDSNPRRQQIEKHLAECDLCRGRLADFEQFVSDSQQPLDRDLTSEWHEFQRRIRRDKKTIVLRRWLPAAVAAVLLVTIGGIWMSRLLSPSPARLLAQAYYEQRTSDFRLAGAAYAQIRVPRGGVSAFTLPEPLLKAQAQLKEQIKSNPDNPELLRLQGEAEMMTHNAATAVRTLQMAVDLSPQDARVLADLGAAYALRGDLQDQFDDYSSALEDLSRSLQIQPGVTEVVFNRALVLEKKMLFDQAVQEWQNYLQLDSSSGWADEARKHLSVLQQKMKSRKERLEGTQGDPAKFLALVSSGAPFDPEAYLGNYAVTEWLPRSGADKTAETAIATLSRMLAQHGDYWLADMAGSKLGPQGLAAISSLKTADKANRDGRFDAASIAARKTNDGFLDAGNLAGSLQVRLLEVVVLKNLLKNETCQVAAEKLEHDLSSHPYLQLRARVRMEHAICAMRSGQLKKAADLLRQAITISEKARLDATALEANNRYLASVGQIGLQSEVFSHVKRCLDLFWAGAYSARLFYQPVDDLRLIASSANQPYTAWFLARSAVWAITEDENRFGEAMARANLAVRAEAVGEEAEAQANLRLSDPLLSQFLPAYRIESQTSFAGAELERGQIDSAFSRLENLRRDVPAGPLLASVRYYSILGEALRRKGVLREAVEAFRQSIALGSQRHSSMSDRERAGILKTMEGSYRGLVATTLAQGNPDSALTIWQSYRAQDSRIDVRDVQSHAGPVLWFIELPDAFISFLTRNGQTTLHRLEISKEPLATLITRFRRECSDPAENGPRLQQDAQQLYRWMIEPFAAQLTEQDKSLVFDLDGVFSAVPVEALIASDGTPLGNRFALTVASGYGSGARQWSLEPNAMAVIVANPAVTGDSAAQFPALPASLEEARIVRTVFPRNMLIQGRAASVANLVSALPTADFVHFAGHGSTDWENGALVLTAEGSDAGGYELLRSAELQQQDWSRSRLVVLSACAVAKGETTGTHNPDSLVRALTKAGALRVLASSWNVDAAATAELMKDFYALLATGSTPDRALQAAQQSVRRQPGWSHPYYWAGFQLYGTV